MLVLPTLDIRNTHLLSLNSAIMFSRELVSTEYICTLKYEVLDPNYLIIRISQEYFINIGKFGSVRVEKSMCGNNAFRVNYEVPVLDVRDLVGSSLLKNLVIKDYKVLKIIKGTYLFRGDDDHLLLQIDDNHGLVVSESGGIFYIELIF